MDQENNAKRAFFINFFKSCIKWLSAPPMPQGNPILVDPCFALLATLLDPENWTSAKLLQHFPVRQITRALTQEQFSEWIGKKHLQRTSKQRSMG